MPGRQQIPSFQMARGSTNERDTQTEVGSIFYNTDTSNVEVYHEDLSNNVGWRDLVMNNKEQIDISGDLYVGGGDIYGNGQLDFYTATNADNSIGWFELRQDKTIMGGDNIQFRTGSTTSVPGTERMRILSNGNVGINETAPTAKLHVAGNIKASGVLYCNNITAPANNFFITPNTDNQGVAYTGNNNGNSFRKVLLSARDTATSTDAQIYFVRNNVFRSWSGISSDSRIKENQTEYKIEDSMNIVKSLKVKKYFNTDSQKEEIGLIAQEVEKILPDAVSINDLSEFNKETDFRFLDYDKVLVHSLGAIQLLEERLAILEAKINNM